MDYTKSVSYNPDAKARFHRAAKKALRAVAVELKLPAGSFEVRSNQGGIAVSGEVTLHGESLYVQASQPFGGGTHMGLLIRSCKGRKDYTGGPNGFASLDLLNDVPALADTIRRRGLV
jgi:hypothetical protein